MLKDLGVDKVFVVHGKFGYELREQRVNQLFAKNNIEFEYMTEGDVSNFTPEILQKYFLPDFFNTISAGHISCTLNHLIILEKIIENNFQYTLIFEDDPYFLGNFKSQLKQVVEEMKNLPPGFIISLENSTLKTPKKREVKQNKVLYPANVGRCCGAYLIDLEGAKKCLAEIKLNKCNAPIDWWHNQIISKNIIQMYWAHPAFVEQCSHNGITSSAIEKQQISWKRRVSWEIKKFYKLQFLYWIQ